MKPHFFAKPVHSVIVFLAVTVITGCASQPEPAPRIPKAPVVQKPSAEELLQRELSTAYNKLDHSQLQEAHDAYRQILDKAAPGTRAYHEACAGLILALTQQGDNPIRDISQALTVLDTLNASMARATRTLGSDERILFFSLRQMLEGEFRDEKLQEQLNQEKREQQRLIKENQQLQEALFKLRRLSLE